MKVNEIISEHRMVWKRNPKGGVKMKWRCESGPKKGRTVPNVNDCSSAKNIAQAQKMKVTRANTKIRQAKKAKKTKRVNPSSLLSRRLNQRR